MIFLDDNILLSKKKIKKKLVDKIIQKKNMEKVECVIDEICVNIESTENKENEKVNNGDNDDSEEIIALTKLSTCDDSKKEIQCDVVLSSIKEKEKEEEEEELINGKVGVDDHVVDKLPVENDKSKYIDDLINENKMKDSDIACEYTKTFVKPFITYKDIKRWGKKIDESHKTFLNKSKKYMIKGQILIISGIICFVVNKEYVLTLVPKIMPKEALESLNASFDNFFTIKDLAIYNNGKSNSIKDVKVSMPKLNTEILTLMMKKETKNVNN